MPSRCCTIRNLGGGNVSHWMHVQFLLFASGTRRAKTHFGCPTTPAMAAALTDHIWSIRELLWYKVAPAPWVQAKPKRPRGRPGKPAEVEQTQPKRTRGRPPKYVLAEVLAAARTAGSFTN